jgi:RNA polymerase sigma-70 factor (ECF subfamily)
MATDQGLKEHAYVLLVKRYKQRVYQLTRSILHNHEDANDATQNTFIKLWEKHHSFKGNSGLFTWLYRVASNESLAILRKAKRLPFLFTDMPPADTAGTLFLNTKPGSAEQKLEQAIKSLPDRQRMIFCLRYFSDLSYAEISAYLNISESALKSSYHFALKKIELQLSNTDF